MLQGTKMKRCLCLFWIALLFCQWRIVAGQGEVWKVYINPRFGFRIEYPASLKADRPPDNGDGQAFHSADGKVRLVASGGFLVAFTFEGLWQQDLERYGNSVTYQKKGETSYVVSGVLPNGVEFYRHLAVQGQNFADFEITYPHGEHAKYDRWVERIARSYVPFLQGDFDRVH
jgi:hypothetical protein